MAESITTTRDEFNGKGIGTAFVGRRNAELDSKERKLLRVLDLQDRQVARIVQQSKPEIKTSAKSHQRYGAYHRSGPNPE